MMGTVWLRTEHRITLTYQLPDFLQSRRSKVLEGQRLFEIPQRYHHGDSYHYSGFSCLVTRSLPQGHLQALLGVHLKGRIWEAC